MSRFVVTELQGWLRGGPNGGPPGLSCHVIDTAYNHRLMAIFRSEDPYSSRFSGDHRRTLTRERAAALAARLNAETP